MTEAERRAYLQVIEARRQNYVAKFEAFQQKEPLPQPQNLFEAAEAQALSLS